MSEQGDVEEREEVKGVRGFFDRGRNRYMILVTRRSGNRGWIFEWRETTNAWVSYRIARTVDYQLFWKHRHQMFLPLTMIPKDAAEQLRKTFGVRKATGNARLHLLTIALPALMLGGKP